MVEIESRWLDYNFYNYHNALLSFPLGDSLNLDYQESFQDTRIWDGADYGDSDVTPDNLKAIAVVFNAVGETNYSYPDHPFMAYPVDACAAATVGNPGEHIFGGEHTHMVFVEEGTPTWCIDCPEAAASLYDLSNNPDYDFYYVALVDDRNEDANVRLDYFDLQRLRTCYFDGGWFVYPGGNQDSVADGITACALREVPPLDLEISLTWLQDAQYEVTVNVTNQHFINDSPIQPAPPGGPVFGVTEGTYTNTASTIDPNDHQLSYWWDWGDGSESGWIGPVNSGEPVELSHYWPEAGSYQIRVKAKDEMGAESGYSNPTFMNIVPRGDANIDGTVNVEDGVFLINFVFKGGQPPNPLERGDANCDGSTNVGDAVYIISFVFKGGPPPGCQ